MTLIWPHNHDHHDGMACQARDSEVSVARDSDCPLSFKLMCQCSSSETERTQMANLKSGRQSTTYHESRDTLPSARASGYPSARRVLAG